MLSRWRDYRLWLGILLVAGSVLVGAFALQRAENFTMVWVATRDASVGEVLSTQDLVTRPVRLTHPAALTPYFTIADQLPTDLTLTAPIQAGALLPRSAIGSSTETAAALSLAVDPQRLPDQVHPGSTVDVWVATQEQPARLVFSEVTVLELAQPIDEFDPLAPRKLTIGLPEGANNGVAVLLALAERGTLTVVAKGS
jgi:hypothetical protein